MGGANGVTCAVESVRPLAFSSEEAAKLLGVSAKTLANWRCPSKGPEYIRLGKSSRSHVLYCYDDHEAWLHSLHQQAKVN